MPVTFYNKEPSIIVFTNIYYIERLLSREERSFLGILGPILVRDDTDDGHQKSGKRGGEKVFIVPKRKNFYIYLVVYAYLLIFFINVI